MSDSRSPLENTPAARAAAIIAEAAQRAKAEIDRATAVAIAEILGEGAAPAIPLAPPAGCAEWVPEWCDVKSAQHELRRSRDRAVAMIRRHGLGCLVDGRWRVDLARVRAFRENRPYPRLQSTPSA